MNKLLPILVLLFFSCDDSISSDSSSTTYGMSSLYNYDDSECLDNENDRTEEVLDSCNGIFKITLNNDGTVQCTVGGQNGGNFNGIWEPTGITVGYGYQNRLTFCPPTLLNYI